MLKTHSVTSADSSRQTKPGCQEQIYSDFTWKGVFGALGHSQSLWHYDQESWPLNVQWREKYHWNPGWQSDWAFLNNGHYLGPHSPKWCHAASPVPRSQYSSDSESSPTPPGSRGQKGIVSVDISDTGTSLECRADGTDPECVSRQEAIFCWQVLGKTEPTALFSVDTTDWVKQKN